MPEAAARARAQAHAAAGASTTGAVRTPWWRTGHAVLAYCLQLLKPEEIAPRGVQVELDTIGSPRVGTEGFPEQRQRRGSSGRQGGDPSTHGAFILSDADNTAGATTPLLWG